MITGTRPHQAILADTSTPEAPTTSPVNIAKEYHSSSQKPCADEMGQVSNVEPHMEEALEYMIMRSPLLITLTFLFSLYAYGDARSTDPYARIERVVAPNGIEIFLSPMEGAQNFQVGIEVKAGFASETKQTAGISHLIEHYLFTDGKLADNMTYLEAIRERGGTGNASTSEMRTTYYATVPPGQSEWLTTTFAKMLLDRRFEQEKIEAVRQPVIIEIGRPSIMDYIGAVGLADLLNLEMFRTPDPWESEFGIRHKSPFPHDSRLNAAKLAAPQLQDYYDKYYWPGNITVFIAGKFNPSAMKQLSVKLYGESQGKKGATLDDWPSLVRKGRYVRSSSTPNMPRISYGVKVWDLTQTDELTLRVYLDYVEHRLMKEIRNRQGGTYSVNSSVVLSRNHGIATINLDTRSEDYYNILNYLKDLIETETLGGGFTEKLFKEAVELYSSTYSLNERDSTTAFRLAYELHNAQRAYGSTHSPYLTFTSLKYSDFVGTLHRLFQKDRTYSSLTEPPILFRYEYTALVMLLLLGLWLAAERLFSSAFEHHRIRLVRKLAYPPAYMLQTSVTFIAIFVGVLIARATFCLWYRIPLVQRSFIASEYLMTALTMALAFGSVISLLSLVKRKIIVSGNVLYIKSLTYSSERIPLSDVVSVDVVRPHQVYSSPMLLWRIKHRFYHYDLFFWRACLLLTTRGGRSYLFGFDDAASVKREIESLMNDGLNTVALNERAA